MKRRYRYNGVGVSFCHWRAGALAWGRGRNIEVSFFFEWDVIFGVGERNDIWLVVSGVHIHGRSKSAGR